jgi:dTDP-4-dehydrorhamnose reductase
MPGSPAQPFAWITGSRGFIGSHLLQSAATEAPEFAVWGLARNQVDLLDRPAVRRWFGERPPQLLIHCAAMSESRLCQENPALARRLNVEMTEFLAELAADIPLIFFSSDLVFDGQADSYDELSSPRPLSVYGETKLAAERIVLSNPRHTVVRTSLNGGVSPAGNHTFNECLRLAWQAGRTLTMFTDEYRCPIPVVVTVRAIWALARQNRPGLYHLAGSECLSRFEIGQAVAARWPALNPRLAPESLRDYKGPPRPRRLRLICAKIQALLPFRLPGLKEWLDQHPQEVF